MNRLGFFSVTAVASLLTTLAIATTTTPQADTYGAMVSRVSQMVRDRQLAGLLAPHKLRVLNVMWEDTGRWKGSSLGPNISDVTIEVHVDRGKGKQKLRMLMPVIRYPNFSDKTADIKLDKLFIPVGNHRKGGKLQRISLRAFLEDPSRYMSYPGAGRIKGLSLLAKRDTHVLVSAQAAFLPIPKKGKATFYPVIFNYQSYAKNPAVLTLVVTRQGTSVSIVDNATDRVGPRSWGQRLYVNVGGKRAPLTAERLSDVKRRGVTQNGEKLSTLREGANVLMLIQVPLKVKQRPRPKYLYKKSPGGSGVKFSRRRSPMRRPDIESAVLGHGKTDGPFSELKGLTIQRDPRFPIRVTVQHYLATSNGAVSKDDVARVKGQIDRVYNQADYVGSLVVPEDLQRRPTEWTGIGPAPRGISVWDFPGLVRFLDHAAKRRRSSQK